MGMRSHNPLSSTHKCARERGSARGVHRIHRRFGHCNSLPTPSARRICKADLSSSLVLQRLDRRASSWQQRMAHFLAGWPWSFYERLVFACFSSISLTFFGCLRTPTCILSTPAPINESGMRACTHMKSSCTQYGDTIVSYPMRATA